MSTIPKASPIDSSLALIQDGYAFVEKRSRSMAY
jgi:hypothetical protein